MKNDKMKFIKLFEEYFTDNLTEAFDNPVEIDWDLIGHDIIIGKFVVNNTNYKIVLQYIIHDCLTFKFSVEINGKYVTKLLNDNSKNYIKVLPTILKGILFILENVKPTGIVFGATDDSRGRKNVYDRFINMYIDNSKIYKTFMREENNEKIYIIYNKNVGNTFIPDVLEYVLKNNTSNNV